MASSTAKRWLSGFREKRNSVKARAEGFGPTALAIRTLKGLMENDATHFAAGISYYGFLSIFPLVLGITALLTVFLDPEQVRQAVTDAVEENVPGASNLIVGALDRVTAARGLAGIISVIGLLWTATAVFGAISRAVNRAWGIQKDRPFYIAKPRLLAMAISVGALLAVSMAATSAMQIVASLQEETVELPPFLSSTFFWVVSALVTLALSFSVFALIYKFIPNTKTYWSDVWLGALIGAILFEASKIAFVFYLNRFASYGEIYGALASVVILLVWMFISALILLLGAQFAVECARMKRGLPQGASIEESERASAAPEDRERESARL
ncbi:MAG: YihY/virulence factor BrkB family protein [Chloroflexi bacterium]|nr:YihY/virulence factor BrkB family protein [Chloroflexota bacterium]